MPTLHVVFMLVCGEPFFPRRNISKYLPAKNIHVLWDEDRNILLYEIIPILILSLDFIQDIFTDILYKVFLCCTNIKAQPELREYLYKWIHRTSNIIAFYLFRNMDFLLVSQMTLTMAMWRKYLYDTFITSIKRVKDVKVSWEEMNV